jgi:hypothetical protein
MVAKVGFLLVYNPFCRALPAFIVVRAVVVNAILASVRVPAAPVAVILPVILIRGDLLIA